MNLTEQELNRLTKTLLGTFPNTYVYTKCIAEQLVRRYGKDLPVGIFRPAIGNILIFLGKRYRSFFIHLSSLPVISTLDVQRADRGLGG